MEYSSVVREPSTQQGSPEDLRAAPRYTSLIRAAKLVSAQGEFVCVIRDVSSLGIGLRMFHDIPTSSRPALELPNGQLFELEMVRANGRDASFTFANPVAVEQLISENGQYPKRQLRLNLAMPLTITTITGRVEAITENISQQGARIECDAAFAINQNVRLEGDGLEYIRAKVRWRRDGSCGLVFENTFALRDFALFAARVQCPQLITGF